MSSEGLIFHRVDGNGEPLLLLNGIAMTAAAWEPVLTRLADGLTVIRCDLRGQLMSPGPPPADPTGHVADLVALLDALGLGSVHVLATSFGAVVAVLLAARHPHRVRSLALAAAADRFDTAMRAEVGRWRAACREALASGDRGRLVDVIHPTAFSPGFRREHAAALAARRRQMADLPDRWFEDLDALMASAEGVDLEPELAAVRCPALVVAAGGDGFIPSARSRALAEKIPGARLEVIRGAGHAVVIERPAELARLVRGFIGALAEAKNGGCRP